MSDTHLLHRSIYLATEFFGLAAVLLAIWKGGRAERYAAAVVVANVAIGFCAHRYLPAFEGGVRFANDGLAAVALLIVTLRYGAPWTGGVMFFYAAQFSLHSYYMVTGRPDNDYLHALVNNVDFIGIVSCLIVGTLVSWRQRARQNRTRTEAAAE